ncbi:uncharacterized protein FOMMEDRAFT_164358 [Fomitiporia mediterranea MF3/22]|uniref:uncharacterized protein n=1 Tax=Fomitiporia mediterranea (strain MF3/22) TaxID=694068 RepID=UPI000440945C|nr:uncharacterized protein FOMMEDRAFT_164358 [Fomitiporia mediterranea MF3/22]EJD07372.1 hypothetical protein FOMMEDRAFT_164358 [Fomitiporia mediterranea MF3/22]
MSSGPAVLKREHSPTPPLSLEPKTSGVKLIAPLPTACHKSSSRNYQDARKQWIREEVKALNALGLSVKKFFIRDDGLALEWQSPVPVWPDTLKPATQPPTKQVSPINVEDDVVEMQDVQAPLHVDQEDLERQATELEDLAIEYLKKYAWTFDTNCALLASAYAKDALFSYSIPDHDNALPKMAAFTNLSIAALTKLLLGPRKGPRNLVGGDTMNSIYSGPSKIVAALSSLGPFKFCAQSPTDLHWNVLALPQLPQHGTTQTQVGNRTQPNNSETPLVYLSSHGYLTEVNNNANKNGNAVSASGAEKRISFDQCFLLRRPDFDPNSTTSTTSTAEWPLVAVNHQLTVRELSPQPLTL